MHPRLLRAACVTAAALTTCALVAPAQAAPGHGKGDKGSHAHGPQKDKVAKEVAKIDARLVRVTKRLDRLDADDAASVTDNVSADRADLADATTRSEAREFRPEVYSWVVDALRKTTRLEAGASTDADAAAVVEAAHAALLGLRATSDRGQLREARSMLAGATEAVHDLGDDDQADDQGDDDQADDHQADDQADDQGDDIGDDSGGDDLT